MAVKRVMEHTAPGLVTTCPDVLMAGNAWPPWPSGLCQQVQASHQVQWPASQRTKLTGDLGRTSPSKSDILVKTLVIEFRRFLYHHIISSVKIYMNYHELVFCGLIYFQASFVGPCRFTLPGLPGRWFRAALKLVGVYIFFFSGP